MKEKNIIKIIFLLSIVIFLIGIKEVKAEISSPPCLNYLDCDVGEGCYLPEFSCQTDLTCEGCGEENYQNILLVHPLAIRVTECFDPTIGYNPNDKFCRVKFLAAGYGASWISCYTCSTPGSVGCGYEADPCSTDSCCPNYMCRYYEEANYYARCCAEGSETNIMCGLDSLGNPLCEDDWGYNTACCSPEGNNDCVAWVEVSTPPPTFSTPSICYEENNETNPSYNIWVLDSTFTFLNKDLTCSNKHWCDVGYEWDTGTEECVVASTPCGNGIIDPGEDCDGTNLNNKDCTNYIPNSPYTVGTLSCNEDCTFDISSCSNCGVEGSIAGCYYTPIPSPPYNYVNQQDSCCGPNVIQPGHPGFTCRYYEALNYALGCCANGDETERMCGNVGGNPICDDNALPQPDVACCSPEGNEDCVYDNECFDDDNDPETAEYNNGVNDLTCSLKHWCPIDFVWEYTNPPLGYCQPATSPCYVGPLLNWCENPYIVPSEDCLNPYPTTTYYQQSCCYDFTLMTSQYYTWQNIEVFSTSAGTGGSWS